MGIFDYFKKKNTAVAVKHIAPKVKTGLALGSGGARGLAHIGVIRAFEDYNLNFDIVAGTSAGSIVGSLYAMGFSAVEMTQFLGSIGLKDIRANSKLFFLPTDSAVIERLMERCYGTAKFSDTKKPFACCAVDLINAEQVVLTRGALAKAVSASCAVPPLYKPVVYDGMHLIDGAFANPIPADVCRSLGAEVVISVEVNAERGRGTKSLKLIDVMMAANRISASGRAETGIYNSDVMIRPNLSSFSPASLAAAKEIISEGYRATIEKMPEIFTALGLDIEEVNAKTKLLYKGGPINPI